jgi:hypothetical protein
MGNMVFLDAQEGDLPLNETFARFHYDAVVTIAGHSFKARCGMIGDGRAVPIEAGIIVLRVMSDVSPLGEGEK